MHFTVWSCPECGAGIPRLMVSVADDGWLLQGCGELPPPEGYNVLKSNFLSSAEFAAFASEARVLSNSSKSF